MPNNRIFLYFNVITVTLTAGICESVKDKFTSITRTPTVVQTLVKYE